MVMQCTV